MKTISVIITTYNDGEYLKRSIPSVLKQSVKPTEIIVVDDGSEDETAEIIINQFNKSTEIPITFIEKDNGGPSSSRNVGIKSATGELIAFLDADDEYTIDSLKLRYVTMSKLDLNYASVYCTAMHDLDGKTQSLQKVIEVDGFIDGSLVGCKGGIPGGPPYHLFRREALNKVGGYDESLKFNEDFELILRLSKKWKFKGLNKVGFIRHIRKNSWSKSDPYLTYYGTEKFLKIATNDELLSVDEILQRKKDNKLVLVKRLFAQRKPWGEISKYIDEAFRLIAPRNMREVSLYILNAVWKINPIKKKIK